MAASGDNGNTTIPAWQLYWNSNKIRHIVYDGSTSYFVNGTTTPTINTWYYIVFVNPNDGSTNGNKLYLNGVLDASATVPADDYGSALRYIYLAKTRPSGGAVTNCKTVSYTHLTLPTKA